MEGREKRERRRVKILMMRRRKRGMDESQIDIHSKITSGPTIAVGFVTVATISLATSHTSRPAVH